MPTATETSGLAPVNGVELHFEIHGSGKPLILLHGGSARSRCSARTSRPLPPAGR